MAKVLGIIINESKEDRGIKGLKPAPNMGGTSHLKSVDDTFMTGEEIIKEARAFQSPFNLFL